MACTISSVSLASATSVSIAFTAYSGGSAFTRYGAQYSTDSGTTWLPATPTIFTANTTATSVTYSGLTTGTTYVFRVSAYNTNTFVSGSSSAASNAITMVATPTAPTVVGGNGRNTLTLAASLSGASTYTIQRDTLNTFNTVNLAFVSDVSAGTTYVDNGSAMPFGAKGTTYFYRYRGVAANGTVGVSSPSSAAAVAYATVPDSVTATTATATSTTAVTVSWTQLSAVSSPRTDGGAAISSYVVEYSADNSTWTVASSAITAASTSYSVASGLTAGTTYYFRVSARNARGTGVAANTLTCSTLAAAPTAITANYIRDANNNSTSNSSVSVGFTVPAGSAITGYTAYSSTGGFTATGTSSPITVTGLTTGTSYTFTVKAATKNSSNTDQLSAASIASAAIVPGVPPGALGTITVGTRTTTATPLSWSAPTASTGLTTSYKIERTLGDGVTNASWTTVVSSQTTLTFAGSSLTANNQYTWRITPFNAAGFGTAATVTTWTLPNASIRPTNVSGTSDTAVSFTLASTVAGQTYNVIPYYLGTTAQTATQVVGLGGTMDNIAITGLTANAMYTFRAQAVNGNGDLATLSTVSVAAYLSNTVTAPSGRTYIYSTTSFSLGILQYTDIDIANAVFDLTTVDSNPAWKITVGGVTDYLVGVRVVVCGSNATTSPRAYLFGSGSGNVDLNSYSSPSSIGVTDGSYMLFAAGETYTRAANTIVWTINRAVTFKGIGTGTKAKLSLLYTGDWTIHCASSNITMENIELNGNNNTRSPVFFKATGSSIPLSLIENFTFKNVDFKNLGSKAIDFHYVKGITFDGCTIDAPTNGSTIAITSCKDVTIKNSTIGYGSWGTFAFMTSDGPNYLWNNSTSSLWPTVGETQASYEARRLAALNNSNIDLTENNTFGTAFIYTDLYKRVTIAGSRLGLSANLKDMADTTSEYQLSLPYTELKLPADFKYEYSKAYSAAPSFNFPYKNVSTSLSHSTTALAHPMLGTSAIVSDLSTSQRIYPAGYELAPGTPAVTATRDLSGGKINLSWSAVAANADSGMDATAPYTVSMDPSAGSILVSGTTATVTGLTNGTSYAITVTAKNAAGLTSSDTVTTVPARIPNAPTDLSFTAHDTSVTVSCVPPTGTNNIGANSIAGYRVRAYLSADASTPTKEVESATNNILVENLSDNTDYFFTVAVKNDVLADYSAESVRSSAQRTVTSPGAPAVNTPSAGYKTFDISWSAPVVTGGNTAFTYKVKYILAGVETVVSVDGTSTQITGLTGGSAYNVMVAAVGNIDSATGSYSIGQTITPYAEPAAMSAPTVDSATSTSISLSWSAPNNNGASISAYALSRSTDGTVWVSDVSTNALSYTVTGLSPNTSYKFRVSAYSEGGWSPDGSVLTTSTTAGAPTINSLGGAGRSLTLIFTAPANATGVTGYGILVDGEDVDFTITGSEAAFTVDASKTGPVSVTTYAITAAGNGAESTAITVSVPLADPKNTDSIKDAIADNTSIQVTLLNSATPVVVPVVEAAAMADVAANAPIVLKSSTAQELKAPVVAVKLNETTPAAVKAAVEAAEASGISNIAIVRTSQIGTEDITATVVYEKKPLTSDFTIENKSTSADNTAISVTTKLSESVGVPANGQILFAVEPVAFKVEDDNKPAPVAKKGINISFKILDENKNVVSKGFKFKVDLNMPNKAGAGKQDIWHNNDDGTFSKAGTAIETPLGSGIYPFTFTQNPDYTGTDFGIDPTPGMAICFLGNAPVLTPAGYRRIDKLRAGDMVQTADGRNVQIKRVVVKQYKPNAAVNPYIIPAGQYGATEPVLISPHHRVAVPGKGMVEARSLGLQQMKMRAEFDYYNIELPSWETDNIVVAGIEAESLAHVRRVTVTKEQFMALVHKKYGALTPDLIDRASRTCFVTADGHINIPMMKRASQPKIERMSQ